MSAIRSIAGRTVASPTVLVARTALNWASPWGSRTRAISLAMRSGDEVDMSQPSFGRRMSAPINWIKPMPRILVIRSPRRPRSPAAFRSLMSLSRQSRRPSTPAPVDSHRSCQVAPGCNSSQSSTVSRDSFRLHRVWESSARNGGTDNRATTVARSRRVAIQVAGIGRGGNFFHNTKASALSCHGCDAARVLVAVVMGVPDRTAHPGCPVDNAPMVAPVAVSSARTAADGARGRPR